MKDNKKSMKLTEELWEELLKLKLEWRCSSLNDVVTRLHDESLEDKKR